MVCENPPTTTAKIRFLQTAEADKPQPKRTGAPFSSSGIAQLLCSSPAANLYELTFHRDRSTKYYFFLVVDNEKQEEFERALTNMMPLDAELYGSILADGIGSPLGGIRKYAQRRFEFLENRSQISAPDPGGLRAYVRERLALSENERQTNKHEDTVENQCDFLAEQMIGTFDFVESLAVAGSRCDPRIFPALEKAVTNITGSLTDIMRALASFMENPTEPTPERDAEVIGAFEATFFAVADLLSEAEVIAGVEDSQDYGTRATINSMVDLLAFFLMTRDRHITSEHFTKVNTP
jgi:hypothetical protein